MESKFKKIEVLKLTSSTNKGNFFQSGEGFYFLRPVDREYKGTVKKPVYYLSKKEGSGLKFISGFFPTNQENTFTYDIKNNIGMKHFMIAEFKNNGQELILRDKE